MPFNPITTAEITTGEPVSNETQTKIKENFDNLESRVTTLEGGGSTVYPPLIMRVNGSYGEPGDLEVPAVNILATTLNFNLVITGVRIIIDKAGISGTTEIDLKYKRGPGTFTSIFSTKPSISHGAGDYSTSTNAVLNPSEVNLEAGDILALSITEAQMRAIGMSIRIDFSKT